MDTLKIVTTVVILVLVTGCASPGKIPRFYGEVPVVTQGDSGITRREEGPQYDSMQIKYARYLGVTPDMIENTRLYYFIEKWLHTPYKWGGTDKNGIDCSAFLQRLLEEVYMIHIPRTSTHQFLTERVEKFKSIKHLSEGDLVFFRTKENTFISHVGLYLHNNIFVNSSSSKGVSLANLDSPYWKTRYIAAGRIKITIAKKYTAENKLPSVPPTL